MNSFSHLSRFAHRDVVLDRQEPLKPYVCWTLLKTSWAEKLSIARNRNCYRSELRSCNRQADQIQVALDALVTCSTFNISEVQEKIDVQSYRPRTKQQRPTAVKRDDFSCKNYALMFDDELKRESAKLFIHLL